MIFAGRTFAGDWMSFIPSPQSGCEIVDHAEVERAKRPSLRKKKIPAGGAGRSRSHVHESDGQSTPLDTRTGVEICKRIEEAESHMKRLVITRFTPKSTSPLRKSCFQNRPKERFDRVVSIKSRQSRSALARMGHSSRNFGRWNALVDEKYMACQKLATVAGEKLVWRLQKLDKKLQTRSRKILLQAKGAGGHDRRRGQCS